MVEAPAMSAPLPMPAIYAATAFPVLAGLSCRATDTKIPGAPVVPGTARTTRAARWPSAVPLRTARSWIEPGGATWSTTGLADTRISANPAHGRPCAASALATCGDEAAREAGCTVPGSEAQRSRMELSMPVHGETDRTRC